MKKHYLFLLLIICFFAGCQGCNKNAPIVFRLKADNWWVIRGEKINITCETKDLDKNNLQYTWSSKAGTFSEQKSNKNTVIWTAPKETSGEYLINVEVSDGRFITSDQIYISVVLPNEKKYHAIKGYIRENTIWKKEENSAFLIKGDLVIEKGVSLIIEPGVIIYIQANLDEHNLYGDKSNISNELIEIIVKGVLKAEGVKNNKIYFISTHTKFAFSGSEYDYTNYEKSFLQNVQKFENKKGMGGNWSGIKFYPESQGELNYCHIKYAKWAIQCISSSPQIKNCIIEKNGLFDENGSIYLQNSKALIENNEILQSGGGNGENYQDFTGGKGIYVVESSPIIQNNFFKNNGEAIFLKNSPTIKIQSNTSPILIKNNTFENNIYAAVWSLNSKTLIKENEINNSTYGYGIYIENSMLDIKRNNITGMKLFGIYNHPNNIKKVFVEECYIANNNTNNNYQKQYENIISENSQTIKIENIGKQ
ncbi:MAG: right-handed parallel beta-helix repeat-containing protein [bacterium]